MECGERQTYYLLDADNTKNIGVTKYVLLSFLVLHVIHNLHTLHTSIDAFMLFIVASLAN